jgi:translocation and assembly module TamB
VRSFDDLTANLDATLRQSQAFQFPVLSHLPLFMPSAGASSAMFQSGALQGTLSRSVFRIRRLELVGQMLQLIVQGTVTLTGSLNLEATANTGQLGPNQAGLRLLRVQLPGTGPAPHGLLSNATSYLSNRVIHLRIAGTIHHPVIQIEPLSLITQEALLFFVSRAWMATMPAAALLPMVP